MYIVNDKTTPTPGVISLRDQAWNRFFARYFDIALVINILSITSLNLQTNLFNIYGFIHSHLFSIFILLEPGLRLGSKVFTIICASLIWLVIIEPLLLNIWGYTPGKALYKIKVSNQSGHTLSYQEGLRRCLGIWFFGFILTLPLLMFIGNYLGYRSLTKKGITAWDNFGNFTVSCGKPSTMSYFIALIVFAPIIYMAGMLLYMLFGFAGAAIVN